MKYIKILIAFCALCIAPSCVDDDKLFELDDFETGALLNFSRTTNDLGFVDIFDIEGTKLEFSVDFSNGLLQDPSTPGVQGSGRLDPNLEFAPVASYDVLVRWRRPATGQASEGVLSTGNTNWPATLSYTANDLIEAIAELNTGEDMDVGDIFTITSTIHMQDGRTLPGFLPDGNNNPTIAYSPSYPGQPGLLLWLDYNVACSAPPLNGVMVDFVADPVIDANGVNLGPVTGSFDWQQTGATSFSWGNYTFGVYQNAFGCCEQGRGSAINASIICNDLSLSNDGFGGAWILSVDELNGPEATFSITGTFFTSITVKMTRQDGQDWPPLF